MSRALSRYEPLWLLAAGPPLVFPELFPPAVQAAALVWIALLWLARRLEHGRWTVRTVADAPIVALLATVPAAAWMSIDHLAAVSRAESLVFAVAVYYALANAMTSRRRVWATITVLLSSGLALATVGLVSVGWQQKLAPLAPIVARLPRLVTDIPHPVLRGTAVHPNELAALLVLFVPLALACLGWPYSRKRADARLRRPRRVRPLAWLTLVVVGVVLVLTQSRGAWLGLFGALVLMLSTYLVQARKHNIRHAATAVIPWLALSLGIAVSIMLFLVSAGPGQLDSGGRDELVRSREAGIGVIDLSISGRVRLWRDVLGLVGEKPLTGIGLNSFPLVHGQRPEYRGGFVYQGLPHAHNTLLQAAIDYGVPGFVAVVALFTAVGWAAVRAHRRLKLTPMDAPVIGLVFGLAAHVLHGMVDAVAIGAKPGFVVWAFAGVLAGIRHSAPEWVHRTRDSVPSVPGDADPVSRSPA